jgi:hypothetical protein
MLLLFPVTALLQLVGEWYKTFTLHASYKLSTRPLQR